MDGTVQPDAITQMQQQMQNMQLEMNNLRAQNQTLQNAVHLAAAAQQPPQSAKGKPLKPRKYAGRGDLDAWLFSIKQYCQVAGITDDTNAVAFAGTCLEGPALDWWRILNEETPQNVPQNPTAFTSAIKARFVRTSEEEFAASRLFKFKQRGSLRNYVESFQRVAIKCTFMDPKTKLHLFLNGLKREIHDEVYRQDPRTVEDAMRMAERYDNRDYMRREPRDRSTPMEVDTMSGRRDGRTGGNERFVRKCYVCGEPGHLARECRKRNKGKDQSKGKPQGKPHGKPKPRINVAEGSESDSSEN
jgi:hypothetical protein